MTSFTVAVAGGTGGIGRNIVNGLVQQGKHEILILSRKSSTLEIGSTSIRTIATDYSNIDGMKTILKANNITIIISALILASPEGSQAQLNLISAAAQSGIVKKFLPSEYGIHYTEEIVSFHPAARYWLDAADALRKSNMQFTRVIFGWTLDHYGLPRVHSYMKPFKYVLDFDNRKAAIPGDGEQPVSFLHTADLARYIGALLEEDDWPELSAFVADTLSWKEFVGIAEKVTGAKWEVKYDSVTTLEKGEATILPQLEGAPTEADYPGMRAMISEFGLMAVRGVLDVSRLGVRNEEFPQIKPMGVEEVVEKAWGKGPGA
ncbi:uncharacterized protein N0V89_004929 [Didymosphaeria variabile]|uniref:NmrA-like domain-containing protein n=1 Tax=Didymosphaeria variabile TaxID=1932322 RepID=A0A9W8XL71_9PLEO|nr:uncharacterized protein N0V89_004929 [Didymosphaeria variabile]KAJ4353203.1 hypothetical protein N0V89_004929 [Didymosphaeria variabile]